MKRRQTVRRLEIIAIVAVVAVSLGVGFYFALNSGDPRAVVDGLPVSQRLMTELVQSSQPPYGTPGSQYSADLKNLSGPAFTSAGKPILVYVGAEYCPYCAVQRWSIVLALMRFGNFTKLTYMTSAVDDGDFSTVSFYGSSYQSNYVVFQPFETYDRSDNPLVALPQNYSTAFQDEGKSSFPFLNFANQYYISGAILDPGALGTLNQSQIVAAIQSGNTLGSDIKQAANVITAAICLTTGNKPASVCNQDSITALTVTLAYTTPAPTNTGSELLVASEPSSTLPHQALLDAMDYSGWE